MTISIGSFVRLNVARGTTAVYTTIAPLLSYAGGETNVDKDNA